MESPIITVKSIMTPKEELITCSEDVPIDKLREEATQHHFDVIPLSQNGKIDQFYFVHRNSIMDITRDWLISLDTTIEDLIQLFVDTNKPAFFVIQKQEIVGIVTPADLNKIPSRMYFYNLVGELEVELVGILRDHFNMKEKLLLESLRESTREQIIREHNQLKAGNAEVDIFQLLYLSDIFRLINTNDDLREKLKIPTRSQGEKLFQGIDRLRNQIMHPSRFLIQKIPDDLNKLNERVQRVRYVLNRIKNRD